MRHMRSSVRQNVDLSRFELEIEGQIAFVQYRLADGVMNFTHTEVPRALRERGIGTQVVLGALAAVREQGLKVRPLCSFVRATTAQHPRLQDLLA